MKRYCKKTCGFCTGGNIYIAHHIMENSFLEFLGITLIFERMDGYHQGFN